jgi:hypothetical protein
MIIYRVGRRRVNKSTWRKYAYQKLNVKTKVSNEMSL